MQIFVFFALVIAILAIIFAVQNNDTTTVKFFAWETQGSLALVLLIALAVGALINFLVSLPANIKARWTVRAQRKKLNELEISLAKQQTLMEEAQKKPAEIAKPVEEGVETKE
jgi:uncharacterized integral membrane protein